MVNLTSLINEGNKKIMHIDSEREEKHRELFRGGSCGAYIEGLFYGNCPRSTILRMEGINPHIDLSTAMMFQLGINHEEFIYKCLVNNPEVKYISREHQLTDNIAGRKWSGRADFLVTLKDKQEFVIESKAFAAESSAKKILEADVPYFKAILQAANYAKRLQVNAKILYGLYFICGNYSKRYKQQMKEYDVSFEGDDILLDERPTGFTVTSLDDYYIKIQECIDNDSVPDRAKEFELNGMKSYNRCTYCEHKNVCEEYDRGKISTLTHFLEEVKYG